MASLLHLHTNAALPFGSPTSFPCVDCGLLTVTGEFCGGSPHTVGFNGCFATNRIATDYPAEQYDGMYTPLCTYCETRHDHCRFCRRVSSCTPPTRKHHWSETHEEPPRHSAEICSLPNENQRLEAANEALTQKLHQAQLAERTLLQTGISRETDLAGLEEEIRRLKLQYEGSPPEEDQANSTHCMICTNCTMEITIRTNPVQGITMEGASLLYPKTTHGSNDLNNSNLRYWMCTPCYEDQTANNQHIHLSPTNSLDPSRSLRAIPSRAPVLNSSPFCSRPATTRPAIYERAAFRPPLIKAHSWPRLARTDELAQILTHHHDEMASLSHDSALFLHSALDLRETQKNELAHLHQSSARWQEVAQQLGAANVALMQELDQAQRSVTTRQQITMEREVRPLKQQIAALKQQAKNWKLRYEAILYDMKSSGGDRPRCTICNKVNTISTIWRDTSEDTGLPATPSLPDPGEWLLATTENGHFLDRWMCTPCFQQAHQR